jgi:hypothetical protein
VIAAVLLACAVCATADPTLVAAGEERPYRGRIRADADVRVGSVAAGNESVDDHRVELGFMWAPLRDFEIGLATPFLFRRVDGVADQSTLGDVEIRSQFLAYEARGSFGRRRFGLLASLKLPTAPIGYDERGVPLSSALQPGCGSIAPAVGAYFMTGRAAWSFYTSASLFLPFSVRDGPHASDSLRLLARMQYQPRPWIAARLGALVRVDASGQLANGVDDPNSGGAIAQATGEIALSPLPDLVFTLGAFVPVAQAFRGTHSESAIASATLAYDF